ncbi:MAG: hypothetical protein IJQ23_04995 [Clostridia bacterium]|nr:hypothetical protein [Clostridia bacterium]
MIKVIKSTGFRQEDILSDILFLYAKNGIDADITYSVGQFYRSGEVPQPKYKFDILPQTTDTVKADSRHLPVKDGSFDCVVFDPPFLVTKGPSLMVTKNRVNMIVSRFGWFSSECELFSYYRETLTELKRTLKNKGIVIFKCQDKVASGKQYISHNLILNMAADLGFYCEDIFILLAKTRLISLKHKNQKHARKYHSYFLVLRKDEKAVKNLIRGIDGRIYNGTPALHDRTVRGDR